MVSELTKLGVPAGELPDGIWITGVDPETAVRDSGRTRAHARTYPHARTHERTNARTHAR
eukprot:6200912-Pleurochrysis_carterae.AAC.2